MPCSQSACGILTRPSGPTVRIDAATIEQFERKLGTPTGEQIQALANALEKAGAQFIPENGGGVGVRLKFNRSETKRIANLENEGGPTASDEVP